MRAAATRTKAIKLPLPNASFSLVDNVQGVSSTTGIFNATFTRAAPDVYETWNGTRYTKTTDEPRFEADSIPLGLLIEGSRVNYFLNSDAPVTQTVTLGTGDFTLWIEGSGSATSSAGTATGTGFGAATEGSPNTFNLSVGGTVDITLAGSVTICQVENGATPTSFILTAGSTVTRAADVCSFATSGIWPVNDVSVVIEFTPKAEDTDNHVLLSTYTDASNKLLIYYNATQVVVQKRIAATNYLATIAFSYSAGTTYTAAFRISSTNGVDVWVDGTKGTGNANTTDAVIATDAYIGQEGSGGALDFANHKNLMFYPELSDADMARLTS